LLKMIDRREIALGTLTVKGATFWERIDAAAAAGFDSVSVRLYDENADDPSRLVVDPGFRRQTITHLRDRAVSVLDVEFIRLQPETDLAPLPQVFECAAELGARALLVTGWDKEENRMAENFARVCGLADEFGLRPALEFMAFSTVRDLDQAVRVLEGADHPAGGLLIDPLHLRRTGGTPADLAAALASESVSVVYGQICDAPLEAPPELTPLAEAAEHRLGPGEGGLPLRELLRILPADLPLSAEVPNPALSSLGVEECARRMMGQTEALLGS
jgi:sugar phosphate isomerase/epimerase